MENGPYSGVVIVHGEGGTPSVAPPAPPAPQKR